jgi:hypothetical protein
LRLTAMNTTRLLSLFAVLGCACTDGSADPKPTEREPAVEPAPARPPLFEDLWAQGVVEFEYGKVDVEVPIAVRIEPVASGRRWRYSPAQPNGQALTVTVTAELPQPSSLEDARARLEVAGLEELAAKQLTRGFMFVHADPRRTTLSVDSFVVLHGLPFVCAIRFVADAPPSNLDMIRQRLEDVCANMDFYDNRPVNLGNRGLIGAEPPAPSTADG